MLKKHRLHLFYCANIYMYIKLVIMFYFHEDELSLKASMWSINFETNQHGYRTNVVCKVSLHKTHYNWKPTPDWHIKGHNPRLRS